MNKRGQLTIFIIMGIVIVAFSIFFFVRPEVGFLNFPESNPIQLFIQSCIDQIGQDAVYFIGLQGGYYNVPNPKENYSYIEIPVYLNVNEQNIPLEENIQKEILKYIQDKLPICLGNFSSFREQGFDVIAREISGKIVFSQKDVVIDLDYPIFVRSESSSIELRDFSSKVDVNFNEKYEFVNQIFEEQRNDLDSIPLGFITNLAYENDFLFETVNIGEKTVLFTLIFEEDTNNFGDPFIYSFINKYDWEMGN